MQLFHTWINAHYSFIRTLPNTTAAFKDLKRIVTLIMDALPDMFHYLDDPNIPATTNALEGFYSRLKSAHQRHRGLSPQHRINYLNWYCYFICRTQVNDPVRLWEPLGVFCFSLLLLQRSAL